jgi:O-antigen chain-terminating methyltransferase
MKKQLLNINDIIEIVSLEAQALKISTNDEVPQPKDMSDVSSFSVPKVSHEYKFERKDEYRINEFLRFEDIEFVENVFKGILQREVDDSGLSSYLSLLRRQGGRLFIIADLLLSEEGRKANVKVHGFSFYFTLFKLVKVLPVGQTFLAFVNNVYEKFGQYEKMSGRICNTEKQLVNSQLLLIDELKSALKKSHVRSETLEGRINNLADKLESAQQESALVRQDLRYQQRSVSVLLEKLADADAAQVAAIDNHYENVPLDAYYVAFEDACRGDRASIRKSQEYYLPLLGSPDNYTSNKLLDLGCGRGEWLQLMSEHQWDVCGIDLNLLMVQQCQQEGLNAEQTDALSYLRETPDNSLAIVTGFHIIEHLPFDVLFGVFAEAMRVLVPGGRILFETPNPENLLVASHTFYHDPTHRNPITPTSIEFLASYNGFVDTEIIRLHPYPEEAKVKGIDPLTERVNGHLCGPQDFAIAAVKPEGGH